MMKNKEIGVGSFVKHTSVYGMGKQSGRVIAEAGTKYGRRYVWVNYTTHNKTFNSAFWDGVLVLSSVKTPVCPSTVDLDNHVSLHTS